MTLPAYSWQREGIDYELFTPEAVAKDASQHIIVNEQTGEKGAWPQTDTIPDGYKILEEADIANRHDTILDRINKLIAEHGSGKKIHQHEEGHQIGDIELRNFLKNGSPVFAQYYLIVARQNDEMLGLMTFGVDSEGAGELDKAVVKQSARRVSGSGEGGGAVTGTMSLLALATMVVEFHCDKIHTNPGSEQGMHAAERGGYKRRTDREGTTYYTFDLDERVLRAINTYVDGLPSKDLKEIKIEELGRIVAPIMREIWQENHGGEVRHDQR